MMRFFLCLVLTANLLTSCRKEHVLEVSDDGVVESKGDALSVKDLKHSMMGFRESLSEELLLKCSNSLGSKRLYLWHNIPAIGEGKRDGIYYGQLNEVQLNQFKSMLQLFLSVEGYQKVNAISVLCERYLEARNASKWHADYYWIDLFGNPEEGDSWGFQLDGHHCVVNFLVQGESVSIVPTFLGASPAKFEADGEEIDVFKDERDLAVSLFETLTPVEKELGFKRSAKRGLKVGPAKRDGEPDPYRGQYDYSEYKTGLKAVDMSPETQKKLVALMKEYVFNVHHSFAQQWWEDIEANLSETYFIMMGEQGEVTAKSKFYYRIYNPYLWVEFNVQGAPRPSLEILTPWNHIHTITRIPNNPKTKGGGDYGEFAHLVNQHGPFTLEAHHHVQHEH